MLQPQPELLSAIARESLLMLLWLLFMLMLSLCVLYPAAAPKTSHVMAWGGLPELPLTAHSP